MDGFPEPLIWCDGYGGVVVECECGGEMDKTHTIESEGNTLWVCPVCKRHWHLRLIPAHG